VVVVVVEIAMITFTMVLAVVAVLEVWYIVLANH
jgi:hypothetical protein